MRKSLWSPDEDEKLRLYVAKHGCGNWSDVAKHTGLHRCGKSCRLRWINYLRPDLKRGPFTAHEIRLVVHLHNNLGNSWSKIASHLPGRTDNDVKNFWHSYTRSRRLQQQQKQQQLDSAPNAEKDACSIEEETCCFSDAHYAQTAVSNEQTKSHDALQQRHGGDEIQQPDLRIPSNIDSAMYIPECDNVIGFKHQHSQNNLPPFSFSSDILKHYGRPSSSSDADTIINSPDFFHPSLYYPSAVQMPPMRAVNINDITHTLDCDKPSLITMHHRESEDADCVNPNQHQVFSPHATITMLDSYIAPFDQSSSSQDASNGATSYLNSKAMNGPDQEWSLLFGPSNLQVYNLINSHVVEEKCTPKSDFDQVDFGMGSIIKPPEGLQSVIWSFINQQEVSMAVLSSNNADEERPHEDHLSDHLPLTSSSTSCEAELQLSMAHIIAFNQHFNEQDAASFSSTSIQHLLQDQ